MTFTFKGFTRALKPEGSIGYCRLMHDYSRWCESYSDICELPATITFQ